jgi:hypothetical protein
MATSAEHARAELIKFFDAHREKYPAIAEFMHAATDEELREFAVKCFAMDSLKTDKPQGSA